MEMLELLPEPFRTAYQRGDNIDYKVIHGKSVHDYVQKYGFTPQMHNDSSFNAVGLTGISLSSYGDWGSVYCNNLGEKSKEIFFGLLLEGIIKVWRIRAEINGVIFDYEDGIGWKKFDKELVSWLFCQSPYINYKKNK